MVILETMVLLPVPPPHEQVEIMNIDRNLQTIRRY